MKEKTPSKPKKSLAWRLNLLHGRIRSCSLCFPSGGNCPVAGTGSALKGGLFLLGQAPGIKEPAAQKNFAWTAGKRLFQWFSAIGMTEDKIRLHAYITAVTKCYPGKASHGKGDRKPSPREIQNCSPYLREALTLLAPTVVVPIGGMAIEQVMGPQPFSEAIGKEYRLKLPGGEAYVIPIPHPSGASPWPYLPGNREKLDKAFQLIRARLRKQKLYSRFTSD